VSNGIIEKKSSIHHVLIHGVMSLA